MSSEEEEGPARKEGGNRARGGPLGGRGRYVF